jgi:hypothetical protein
MHCPVFHSVPMASRLDSRKSTLIEGQTDRIKSVLEVLFHRVTLHETNMT